MSIVDVVHKGEYFDGRLSICLENYASLQFEFYDSGIEMRIYFFSKWL